MKGVNVMVVEDEWGDLVCYGSIACDGVEQTARDKEYREKIRECYPKVSHGAPSPVFHNCHLYDSGTFIDVHYLFI